jgi:hypothetical protein
LLSPLHSFPELHHFGAISQENPLARLLNIKAASSHSSLRSQGPLQYGGAWRSLVARLVRDEEAVGSNPAAPTIVWEFFPNPDFFFAFRIPDFSLFFWVFELTSTTAARCKPCGQSFKPATGMDVSPAAQSRHKFLKRFKLRKFT